MLKFISDEIPQFNIKTNGVIEYLLAGKNKMLCLGLDIWVAESTGVHVLDLAPLGHGLQPNVKALGNNIGTFSRRKQ